MLLDQDNAYKNKSNIWMEGLIDTWRQTVLGVPGGWFIHDKRFIRHIYTYVDLVVVPSPPT